MPTEADQARHKAAIQLIQLIEAVAKTPDVYDQTTSALDVIDAITDYHELECSHQPAK